MKFVGIEEAQARFDELLTEVEAGEEVVLTRDGKPVAKLASFGRRFGALKGQIEVGPEFFEPLPDDELRAWEGGG